MLIPKRPSTRLAGALLFAMFSAPLAVAQPETTLSEMRKLYTSLSKDGAIISARDGGQARERLKGWNLTPDTLKPDDRTKLLVCQVYANLAAGDAASALEAAAALRKAAPDDAAALTACWLAACGGGDAQLAEQSIKAATAKAKPAAKARWIARRDQALGIARDAPDVVIRAEDMGEFNPAQRGDKVLVIDFWNVLAPPSKEHVAAIARLIEESQEHGNAEFVGVNADSETRLDQARAFAKDNGLTWPQRFEAEATDAPITHKAFHAGTPPWTVVIDSYGYVRCVGDPREAAVTYALRCASAEARGAFEPVMPRTRDGKQVERASQKAAQAAEKKPKEGKPSGPLPSNPEAKSKLTQAHSLRRGGMKTKAKQMYEEIVRDYPGTQEAEEARFWLED